MCIIYKHGKTEVFLPLESPHTVEKIYKLVTNIEQCNDFYLTFNGKCLQSDNVITSPCTVRFHLRLPGGKGGFGSMLRAIGARIEKTTNHEACRDLSGRRMRDVNYEKEMTEWLKQKEDEKKDDGEREKTRMEKLEKIINPKHNYQDKGYTSNLQNNAEKIDEALKFALQKRDEKWSLKRKVYNDKGGSGSGKQKKTRMWIGVNDDGDNSDDDGEDIVSVTEDKPSCSKVDTFNVDNNSSSDEKNMEQEVNHVIKKDINSDNCIVSCSSTPSEVHTEISRPCSSAENTELSTLAEIEPNCENCASGTEIVENVITPTDSTSVCGTPELLNTATENNREKSDHDDTKVVVATDTAADAMPNHGVVNLDDYDSAEDLESVGLDVLKTTLMALGLKCGGTLEERSYRLFLTKNIPFNKLHPSLFAKPSKGKNKKQKK